MMQLDAVPGEDSMRLFSLNHLPLIVHKDSLLICATKASHIGTPSSLLIFCIASFTRLTIQPIIIIIIIIIIIYLFIFIFIFFFIFLFYFFIFYFCLKKSGSTRLLERTIPSQKGRQTERTERLPSLQKKGRQNEEGVQSKETSPTATRFERATFSAEN